MDWAFLWLMVFLKVPLIAALWIVWWAVRAEPAPADEDREDRRGDGGDHPRPRRPGPSRRGPHSGAAPRSPARVRARPRRTVPARR